MRPGIRFLTIGKAPAGRQCRAYAQRVIRHTLCLPRRRIRLFASRQLMRQRRLTIDPADAELCGKAEAVMRRLRPPSLRRAALFDSTHAPAKVILIKQARWRAISASDVFAYAFTSMPMPPFSTVAQDAYALRFSLPMTRRTRRLVTPLHGAGARTRAQAHAPRIPADLPSSSFSFLRGGKQR